MRNVTQLENDLFRILLYRNDASELLLVTDAEGLHLPSISIPKYTRVAEELTKEIKDEWHLDTYCLFPVSENCSRGASIPFYAVELWNDAGILPDTMRWLPLAALTGTEFSNQDDFVAVQALVARFHQFRHSGFSGAFARPGWLRVVTEWVAAQAAAIGLSLTGNFRQFNASQTFSLLSFETDGPALWFKAVGEPNVHEFALTLYLAKLFPHFVPRVIASRPDWKAWLSLEAEGAHLGDTTPLSTWQRAFATLADLQVASYGHGLRLIDAGCRDLRVSSLLHLVDPFFDRMAELMELQTKPAPQPLAGGEIRALAAEVRSSLQELNACEIGSVIGHLDLNPGNILVSTERCLFLDWAEGYVGHPFFTFQYLLEHWRRFHLKESHSQKTLVSQYAFVWQAFASPDDITKSLALTPLLAAFAHATVLGWNNSDACHRGATAGYLRSLVRRMKREADAITSGSVPCVS